MAFEKEPLPKGFPPGTEEPTLRADGRSLILLVRRGLEGASWPAGGWAQSSEPLRGDRVRPEPSSGNGG